MEQILKEILEKITSLDSKVTTIENDIKDLKCDVVDIKKCQSLHTGILDSMNEDIKEVVKNQNSLHSDVRFIKHKLHQTEEEVFNIKDHLKIVK